VHASSYRSVAVAPSARNSRAISIASSLAYSVTAIRAFAQYDAPSFASSSSLASSLVRPARPRRPRASRVPRLATSSSRDVASSRVAVSRAFASARRSALDASLEVTSSDVASSLNVGLGGSATIAV
jgi:hypothetical protein